MADGPAAAKPPQPPAGGGGAAALPEASPASPLTPPPRCTYSKTCSEVQIFMAAAGTERERGRGRCCRRHRALPPTPPLRSQALPPAAAAPAQSRREPPPCRGARIAGLQSPPGAALTSGVTHAWKSRRGASAAAPEQWRVSRACRVALLGRAQCAGARRGRFRCRCERRHRLVESFSSHRARP